MNKSLNIIITAGPVWVSLDKVRVITNIFSGTLGYEVAKSAVSRGHRVTLVMGPGRVQIAHLPSLKIIKFHYYSELYKVIKNEIKPGKFDAIVHSAAVSDYEPIKPSNNKIKSNKKRLIIKLKPTIKIVDKIKKYDPRIFLVKFKLEVNKSKSELIRIGEKSRVFSHADIMVANDFRTVRKRHLAHIIKGNKVISVVGKINIANAIIREIEKELE